MQLKIIATEDVLKKQSFPTSVNDTSCANLNAKHAPLKASSNMKGYGNPLITIFYCKVLKKEGRYPPLLSPGNCIPDVWESVKCRWFMPPRVSWSLRNSNGKLHKKSPGIQAQSSSVGELGRGYLLCSVSQTMAKRKFKNERKKNYEKKRGKAIQSEMFLFSSESLAETAETVVTQIILKCLR